METLKEYLSKSEKITHLELSGMQIGESVLELLPEIKKSRTLRVVHFSNNLISKETKKFMFNTLMQDFAAAKHSQRQSCPIKTLNNKISVESSGSQMKAINHQLVKKVNESVLLTRVDMDGP